MFMPYANNKGTDQPAHWHSVISAFVVSCLDNAPSFYIQNFKPLPSFCGCAGRFESYLVANTEDRFSCDMAHFKKDFNVHKLISFIFQNIQKILGLAPSRAASKQGGGFFTPPTQLTK